MIKEAIRDFFRDENEEQQHKNLFEFLTLLDAETIKKVKDLINKLDVEKIDRVLSLLDSVHDGGVRLSVELTKSKGGESANLKLGAIARPMYEIVFKYHKKIDGKRYDTTNTEELKKTLGKKLEEVSLEKLASFVISNLARRDIWIVDVQIFEFAKREISFRETDDGIVLKNKKFLLNGDYTAVESSDIEEPQNLGMIKAFSAPVVAKKVDKQPLRYEIFGIDIDGKSPFKNLTKGKKYPILKELGMGDTISSYIVLNDAGYEMKIDPIFFTNDVRGLPDVFNQSSPGGVIYGGELVDDRDMSPLPRR